MVIVKYFTFFIFKFATAKATKNAVANDFYLNLQPLCNGKAVANNIFYFIFLIFAIALQLNCGSKICNYFVICKTISKFATVEEFQNLQP